MFRPFAEYTITASKTNIDEWRLVKKKTLYRVLFMENIQHYRQPIVTATGISMGFMLNFASTWIKDAFTKNMIRDIILGLSIIVCISLLLIVLVRILKMDYLADKVSAYYKVILRLFIIAVSVPFVAFVLVVIRTLILSAGKTTMN